MLDHYATVFAPPTPARGPETIHVHEHRAPTDDSARLLAELEVAARDRIFASFPVPGSALPFHLIAEHRVAVGDVYVAVFDLNGRRHRVETVIPVWERDRITMEVVATRIINAVAAEIAAALLDETLPGIVSGLRRH